MLMLWMRRPTAGLSSAPLPRRATRRAVAVDGKTLRESGVANGPGRHLLAALDHRYGVVLGQVDVEAKTNEIPMFATVLAIAEFQRDASYCARSWSSRCISGSDSAM